MEKRKLGKTGLDVSLLGFGGFHLVETLQSDVCKLLNHYLDNGGNYIETAASYGNGISENKIGTAVLHRRNEYILVSKSCERSKEGFKAEVLKSLDNLKTDHLDVIFFHGVGRFEDLQMLFSKDGAYESFLELKKEGKVNHLGVSMHGRPDVLINACENYPIDIVMSTINYYDNFNYPDIESKLIPLANKKDIGIVLMKPIADGYLFRSAEKAFQYAFSREVSIVVTGANNMQMLKDDLEYVNSFDMEKEEIKKLEEDIKTNAVELGKYVCRRCAKCDICPEEIDLMEIFRIEGMFDRQMYDGVIEDPSMYALKERLRFWFGDSNRAKEEYARLENTVCDCTKCGKCEDICPYGIDILSKLEICHIKLS